MPSYVRSIAAFGLLFFLVLSVFGIFTGVGLIRLKNWARISILVFSGFTVFFGSIALLFLMAIPFPTNPTGPPVEPGAVKAIVLMVYGIPVLIGIWWLVLFNLKATRAQFAGAPSQTSPEISPVPSCPLPVQIIAVLYLFSLLSVIFIPLIHTPFPAVIFGHALYGPAGKVLFVVVGLLLVIGANGLLKLKKWSYPLVLGIQGFWLLSGVVSTLSPAYPRLMQDVLSQMHFPENIAFPYSMRQLQFFSWFGLLFGALVIGILLYYRRRFMKAASAREAPPA